MARRSGDGRTPAATDFRSVLDALAAAGVEFMVIGGLAANAHGSARVTYDVDVVYRRSRDNHERLVEALGPHAPYLRGAPPGLPFRWDVGTIERGLNFTLTTDLGAVDLLGEVVGGGWYEDLIDAAEEVDLHNAAVHVAALDDLIRMKRAAGRPKDLEAIAELEAIREERDRPAQ